MRTTSFVLTTASALALGLFLTAETAKANDLLIEQVAKGGNQENFASGIQKGNNHETYIGQKTANNFGVRNNSASGAIKGGANNQMNIEQTSDRNVASVFGSGGGTNNTAIIRQGNGDGNGDGNYAAFQMSAGSGNIFGAIQEGRGNAVTSGAAFSFPAPFNVNASAVTEQGSAGTLANGTQAQVGDGNGNFGLVAQVGNNNVMALHQTGFNNTISGAGGVSKTAPSLNGGLAPSGFFSATTIDATTPVSSGVENPSDAGLGTQYGNGNEAILLQQGSFNEVAFLQDGNGYTAEVRQVGTNNAAVAVQTR
jgi:hypothetical protein